ncbi:MAG: isopentenyl-diphosphate Delta-isomerase [Acidobacteria bacterium]|nr:isopentenyl-diphosphate Delta-isomerase [Acidobacteriota bacterium]
MSRKDELLIAVDGDGSALGVREKTACHSGEGIRHSAFLVMLFDGAGRLMLARRSPHKILWPGFWDGTVAGHFHPGEDKDAVLRKRVLEETGLDCAAPAYLFKFAYTARYGDVGAENEVCEVYVAGIAPSGAIPLDPEEVSECRFVALADVEKEIAAGAPNLAPWLVLAIGKRRAAI